MIGKRPQILESKGKPAFAVLPIAEYEAMRRRLEDLEDLALIREAEAADKGAAGRPLAEVMRELGCGAARATKGSPKKRRRA